MKNSKKSTLAFRKFGYKLLYYFQKIFLNNKRQNSLLVLAYHQVNDALIFEEHIKILKNNYNLITVADLEAYFFNKQDLPLNPLMITFDDGDISVLENGFPILIKYDIPAIVFVITQLIDTNETFWCRRVEMVYIKNGKTFADARKTVNGLKKGNETQRKSFLENLEKIESKQLASGDLKELSRNNIFIGNHTHTHPMVNKCTVHQLEEELQNSYSRFEKWKLNGYSVFAYPNGNWDPQSEKILKRCGIRLAFLFDHKVNRKLENPLRISRIRMDSDTDVHEFNVKITGLHTKIMDLKNKYLPSILQ